MLLDAARRALDAGGSVDVEMARFAFPVEMQRRFEQALGSSAQVTIRPGEGLERVVVAGVGPRWTTCLELDNGEVSGIG